MVRPGYQVRHCGYKTARWIAQNVRLAHSERVTPDTHGSPVPTPGALAQPTGLPAGLTPPGPSQGSGLRGAVRAALGTVGDRTGRNANNSPDAGVAWAVGDARTGRADIAMHSANQEHTDIARLVAESTFGDVARLKTAGELRSAVRGKGLDIAYQPIVSLATGRIVALEAFARWTTPSGSAVSPDVFIPMAEETGLIGELGAQILRKATRAAVTWQRIAPVGVRVNVSAHEVESPTFYDDVMRALAHVDLDPRLLGIEINEPLLFAEGTASATSLMRLRAAGISLLLDDFGAGYSSLGSSQLIPVIDVLKIDRTFLAEDHQQQEDLRSVVDLAKARNVEVSAEGVENANQHSLVVELGCDYAQGYYFARPIAGPMVPKMLESWAPFLPA